MTEVPVNFSADCELGRIFKEYIHDRVYEALGVEKPGDEFFADLDWRILEEARYIEKVYSFEESGKLLGAINNWTGLDDATLGRLVGMAQALEKACLTMLDMETPGQMRNGVPKLNALYTPGRAVNGLNMLGLRGLQASVRVKTKTGKLLSRTAHQGALQYLFAVFLARHMGRCQQDRITMENIATKLHFWFSGSVYLAVDAMVRVSGFEGDKKSLAMLVIKLCLFQKAAAAYENIFLRKEDDPLYCSEISGGVLCIPVALGMEVSRENIVITNSLKDVPATLEEKKALVAALKEAKVPERTKEYLSQWRKEIQDDLLPKFSKNEDLEQLLTQWIDCVGL